MSVRRKLFVAMGSIIIGMCALFVLITQFVVKASLDYLDWADRSREIGALSEELMRYYEGNGESWTGVEQAGIERALPGDRPDAGFALLDSQRNPIYSHGNAELERMVGLGVFRALEQGRRTIALLYYYDSEVGNVSIIRHGITSSVTALLTFGGLLFSIAAVLIAYFVSKRLTAPLTALLPAISRLGRGEFGVQAPVSSRDEYGTVANAFNSMSAQLQRAEDVRRQLVADVAHELRTPITIVRGHLDAIQQDGRAVEPERLLPLQDELIRLTRLVDDLHQLSLAEAGRLPLERKPTDIGSLLARIVDRLGPEADSAGIDMRLDVRTERTVVEGDPNRLTQLFLNLILNAIRYTPSGGSIRLIVEKDAPGGNPARLRVSVADTGSGIEPEHLPFIFERFYRTDAARSRNSGGTGLGLAITRQFAELHGGTIEASSVPGQGTTFVVTLPFPASGEPAS